MTTNIIKKKCPHCSNEEADIHGAVIICTDKGEQISFNKYTCIKCHKGFIVLRKGDQKEQALTEKYVKSEPIKLD